MPSAPEDHAAADLEVIEEAVPAAVDDVVERDRLDVEQSAVTEDHPELGADLQVEEVLPVVVAVEKQRIASEAILVDEGRPTRLGERRDIEAEGIGRLDVPPEF